MTNAQVIGQKCTPSTNKKSVSNLILNRTASRTYLSRKSKEELENIDHREMNPNIQASPTSPPSGGEPFSQLLHESKRNTFKTSQLREQLLHIFPKETRKMPSSRKNADRIRVKRVSSALNSTANVENVIHTRMLKRFQNLQEKYNDMLSYNSASSIESGRRGSD